MARRTNLALLVLLAAAFLTGWLAFAYATAPSRWSLVVHAVAGAAILVLVPWKSTVSLRGIRRRRPGWWASLALAALLAVSIVFGWLHSTGVWRWGFGLTAMEFHVAGALLLLPLALWHVRARKVRPHRTDLSRRRLLQAAAVTGGAAALYAGVEVATRAARLPGAGRRFTGSYEAGSFDPPAMPVSSWMFDAVPAIQGTSWRLRTAARDWTLAEVASHGDELRAVLDCTGGFYSAQDWRGAWIPRLLAPGASGSSIVVRSATGYSRRFPLTDAPRLLLATHLGGAPARRRPRLPGPPRRARSPRLRVGEVGGRDPGRGGAAVVAAALPDAMTAKRLRKSKPRAGGWGIVQRGKGNPWHCCLEFRERCVLGDRWSHACSWFWAACHTARSRAPAGPRRLSAGRRAAKRAAVSATASSERLTMRRRNTLTEPRPPVRT